ncbi:integrase core domain contained protein [Zunongwangia atlantica 22II14-10F7]|uniref:Integrase core domain contained protein n=1 Tax=Zunongwangia atlantica 22II14-10F7 TaxID=1185767 RepID=A0A1Y1T007_9FLAO|nr:integrase core domain contained protein [Zunongwangia atlantica 22II14-10F7]
MAYDGLRNEGTPWNHKRVYRVYKKFGLSLKKRLVARIKQPLEAPVASNHNLAIVSFRYKPFK